MEGVEDACALLTVTFCMCSTTARVGLCSQHARAYCTAHTALHIYCMCMRDFAHCVGLQRQKGIFDAKCGCACAGYNG